MKDEYEQLVKEKIKRESPRKKGKSPKKREEAEDEIKTKSNQDRRCRSSRHGGIASTSGASGGDANAQPHVEAAYGY